MLLLFVWRVWVSCWAHSFVCDRALEEFVWIDRITWFFLWSLACFECWYGFLWLLFLFVSRLLTNYLLLCWVGRFVSLLWVLLFVSASRCLLFYYWCWLSPYLFSKTVHASHCCLTLLLISLTEVPVVAQCMPDTFCFASGLSYFPSTYFAYSWSFTVECCCLMPPAPAFALLSNGLLLIMSLRETKSAHTFLASDLIAGLVTWGGSWCSVGL